MKTTHFPFLMIVSALVFFASCASKTNPPSLSTKTQPWHNAYDKPALSGHVLVYRHSSRDWGGRQSTSQRFIHANALWRDPTEGTARNSNPFGLLSVMQDPMRVRDIEQVSDEMYSLQVLDGFKLAFLGQSVDCDAYATLKMQGTRPHRFTFDAILPIPNLHVSVQSQMWRGLVPLIATYSTSERVTTGFARFSPVFSDVDWWVTVS